MRVDEGRRGVLRLLAGIPLLPGALAGGCSGKGQGGVPGGLQGGGPAVPGEAEQAAGARPAPAGLPWAGKFPRFDLVERLGFAVLRHDGLWIDFGTTDAFKYTLGGWLTGWGRAREADGAGFAHAIGSASRVFFPWAESQDVVLRLRVRPLGAASCAVYVGDRRVGRLDLSGAGWAVRSIRIPAASVRHGENSLLLRWSGTSDAGGEASAAAVDWIHVAPASASADAPPFLQAAAQGTMRVAGADARVLLLPGGAGLSYPIDVPERSPVLGMLVARAAPGGAVRLTVRVTADGESPVTLLEEDVGAEPGAPRPVAVDLSSVAGRVVRLDLDAAGGAAGLVLASPAVFAAPERSDPAALGRIGGTRARGVVLVMIDTLRADHTQPYGRTRVRAPALQALADGGALFERFSAVEDWTKPTCATMLTGLYPWTHRAQTEDARLGASVRMMTEDLRERGVRTAAFVANGYVSDRFGFQRGWDHYVNYIREGKKTDAEYVLGDASAWIEANKSERFFAYVHTIDPHVPYAPPPEFLRPYHDGAYSGPVVARKTHLQLDEIKRGALRVGDRDKEYIRALYAGEIGYHDHHLGRFLARLGEIGLLDETMIMVTSDHGEEFWERGSVGHGHSIFQELVHVPFILAWKGTIPAGVRIADNHDHAAIMPTILDALGLDPPDHIEGRSVLPRALGREEPGPHGGFSTHQGERMAVWSGRYKLQMNGLARGALFDLAEDPGSERDLDDARPITLRYMRSVLGHFFGAPDKRRWREAALARANVTPAALEKVEIDARTQQQLEALGYIQR